LFVAGAACGFVIDLIATLSCVRLISWNVNGIRAVHKKGLFVPFVEEFEPDVLCLQETKAQQFQSEVQLPGYVEHWNSAEKKGYSGTATISKAVPLSVVPGLAQDSIDLHGVVSDGFGDPRTEGRVLTEEFAEFYVVNVYTPNSKDDLGRLRLRSTQWDPAFLHYLQLLEKVKPVIACGDFNVAHTPDDLANPKSNVGRKGFTSEERKGFQNYLDAGFVDTFRMFHEGNGHYSWWSHFANSRERNVGWRIDYFLVSASLAPHVTAADIHPTVFGSDHCPISVTLDL
jgi:exodeoxyribonuclease III